MAIVDVLMNFYDGQSHANLWVRVRGAINFLSYYPERSLELRKKDGWDLPKYGFRGDVHELTYEQLVVAQSFLKEHEKRLIQTKKKLPMILDLRLNPEKRKEAASYCMELFSDLQLHFTYRSENLPTFTAPHGIWELLEKDKKK